MKLTKTNIAIALTLTTAVLGGAAFAAQHKEGHDGKRMDRAERMFERADADKDGKVTADEMKAVAAERFAKRDIDGDGVVSREDRKALRTSVRVERRGERFAKIDADGDGMISKDEFVAFTPDREGRRSDKRGDRAERGERRGHHGKGMRGYRMDGHRGDRGGKRKGHRHGMKGPLTIQEAEARAMQRFERIDSDNKGYITLNDVKAHRADKRGRH